MLITVKYIIYNVILCTCLVNSLRAYNKSDMIKFRLVV